MNNMRFLVCTIFTILVAILVYFYVVTDIKGGQAEERSIEQLKRDLADAHLSKDLNEPLALFTPTPPVQEPAPETETEPTLIKQLSIEEEQALAEAEIKLQADALEVEALAAEKAKIDAELAANQPKPISDARLKLIQQALVMATVKHYDEPSRITLLDLARPENVVNGQILGIRRQQSGIIGRVKIARIQNGQAFADPIPESFFGKPVEIREGDELIVIP